MTDFDRDHEAVTTTLDHCPSTHYATDTPCALPPGHRDIWHQFQRPDGTPVRYRQTFGVRATQEWRPDGPGEDSGTWLTVSYTRPPEPTPVLVDDLAKRLRSSLGNCVQSPWGVRRKADDTYETECSCGTVYPIATSQAFHHSGLESAHLTHQAEVMADTLRTFFDMGCKTSLRAFAGHLRDHCPQHAYDQDSPCHCGAADLADQYADREHGGTHDQPTGQATEPQEKQQ